MARLNSKRQRIAAFVSGLWERPGINYRTRRDCKRPGDGFTVNSRGAFVRQLQVSLEE